MLNAFELQKTLVAAALPSGYEKNVGAVIADIARPFCDELYFTPTGNLICHKKGAGKRLMFAAHMDVIGFMATFVDERGMVSFTTIGGHSVPALINTPVRFENGTRGIIKLRNVAENAAKSGGALTNKDLYIDIACATKSEGEALVHIGALAKFDTEPQMVANNCMMTPYADDLASCAALLLAMEQIKESPNDIYCVFTVQEEMGLKGAQTASFVVEPHMGIAIDLCYTGDELAADMEMPVTLGGGPTIKIKDMSVICHPDAIAHLKKAAAKAAVVYQDEIIIAGGTDTAMMAHSRGGAVAGCVSLPGRNIHSPGEIVSLSDIAGAARLLAAAAEIEI